MLIDRSRAVDCIMEYKCCFDCHGCRKLTTTIISWFVVLQAVIGALSFGVSAVFSCASNSKEGHRPTERAFRPLSPRD